MAAGDRRRDRRPVIERVTMCKAVRLGFSTLVTATIGAFSSNDPAPILLLMPTEADARDVVVSEIEPIFQCVAGITRHAQPTTPKAARETR